jgi:hypothetical protein
MSNAKKTYVGSCHCGDVRFEVTTELDRLATCNCSLCSRVGYLMKSVPASDFKLLSGEGKQTDYRFNTRQIQHLFCSTCGVHAIGRFKGEQGEERVLVNFRCVPDLDVSGVPVTEFDGKRY